MATEFVTISVNQSELEQIKSHYSSFEVPNNGEYIDSMFKKGNLVITVYSGKKENKKITFAGNGALSEALLWDKGAQIKEAKDKRKQAWEFFGSQIGSDEAKIPQGYSAASYGNRAPGSVTITYCGPDSSSTCP